MSNSKPNAIVANISSESSCLGEQRPQGAIVTPDVTHEAAKCVNVR